MVNPVTVDKFLDLTVLYNGGEGETDPLPAGTYLCQCVRTSLSSVSQIEYLEWDPTFANGGAWFTDRGTIFPKRSVWRRAIDPGRTPEKDAILDAFR